MLLKHTLSQFLFHHDLEEDLTANLDVGLFLEIVVIISSVSGGLGTYSVQAVVSPLILSTPLWGVTPTLLLFSLSCVWLFATPWTLAHQAPLSMGFFRQEHWSELPCLPPGNLPDSGIEPTFPALQVDSLSYEPPGKLLIRIPVIIGLRAYPTPDRHLYLIPIMLHSEGCRFQPIFWGHIKTLTLTPETSRSRLILKCIYILK